MTSPSDPKDNQTEETEESRGITPAGEEIPRLEDGQVKATALDVPFPRGKDSMNLTDFPFALLGDRPPKAVASLEFSDTIRGEGGKPIQRKWQVGAPLPLGLPLAFEEDLYVVLMQLTCDQGFEGRTIQFSRYDLLRRMGLPDTVQYYARLAEAFRRLQGVQVTATNAFWEPQTHSYVSIGFGIIDDYGLRDEQAGRTPGQGGKTPQSYFTWNETLFSNMLRGYVKNLDVRFYLSLSSNISRRLYRLLDKRRYDGKIAFTINLETLAHERLGFARGLYPSQIKQKLERPHQELLEKGFLLSASIQPSISGGEKIIYGFPPKPKILPSGEKDNPNKPIKREMAPSDAHLEALQNLGLGKIVARRLVRERRDEVERQLGYFPYAEVRTTPGAYLRRAIEEGWGPPPAYEKAKREEEKRQQKQKTEQRRAIEREVEEAEERRQRDAVKALELALDEVGRDDLRRRARERVREANPMLAALESRGKAGKPFENLVDAEFERLLLQSAPPAQE